MPGFVSRFFGANKGSTPKTLAFETALKNYAKAVGNVKNLKGLSDIMINGGYSQKLLNSIAEAFSANNQAKKVVGNPNASAALQTEALENAARALVNVTQTANTKENLNKIMKQIFNSAHGNTNEEKRSLYKRERYSKLNTNIALGSNTYGSFLASLKQNNSGLTRKNELLAQAASPQNNTPASQKSKYANMNATQLMLAAYNKNKLSNSNKKNLADAIRAKRANNTTPYNTNKQLGETLSALLEPKRSFLSRSGNLIKGGASKIGRLVGRRSNNPPNSK
jgi:hypothetical protein